MGGFGECPTTGASFYCIVGRPTCIVRANRLDSFTQLVPTTVAEHDSIAMRLALLNDRTDQRRIDKRRHFNEQIKALSGQSMNSCASVAQKLVARHLTKRRRRRYWVPSLTAVINQVMCPRTAHIFIRGDRCRRRHPVGIKLIHGTISVVTVKPPRPERMRFERRTVWDLKSHWRGVRQVSDHRHEIFLHSTSKPLRFIHPAGSNRHSGT